MQTQLSSDKLTLSINHFGAELKSVKNSKGVEFIWQAKEHIWARHSPVLFPIVGKLKDNTYRISGKEYSMSQHGFARDRHFTCINHNQNSAVFRLSSDAESKKIFPFDFDFDIQYTVLGDEAVVTYLVKSRSPEPMLFSVGAHPGFNCPVLEHEKWEDYYLLFESTNYSITNLSSGFISPPQQLVSYPNQQLFLTEELFNNDALVFENAQINQMSLCSSKSPIKITLTAKNWPYFGVWAKRACKEFVCLEPWHGIADDINTSQELEQKKGIITLAPKSEFAASYTIHFEYD